jgi:hypothetical protein
VKTELVIPIDHIVEQPDGENRLEALLRSVQKKDKTFKFEFVVDPSGRKAVIIQSRDVKQAHRRGIFCRKAFRDAFGVKFHYRILRRRR